MQGLQRPQQRPQQQQRPHQQPVGVGRGDQVSRVVIEQLRREGSIWGATLGLWVHVWQLVGRG